MTKYGEWEIKNFSCWSGEIHGEFIEGYVRNPAIKPPLTMLYPKGVGGKEEHLVVSIGQLVYGDVNELSFIGSDGSLICTRRPDDDSGDKRIYTGPKLEEVVAGIKGNEPLHEDKLILRWSRPQTRVFVKFRTVIDAYSTFFHIKHEVFDLKEHRTEHSRNTKWELISHIAFPFGNGNEVTTLKACKTGTTLEDNKVKFKLNTTSNQKILVRTFIWMLTGDKIMKKYEGNCVLVEGDYFILPYEITLKELQGFKTIMCFKIVNGQSSRNFEFMADARLSPDIRITGFSSFSEIKSFGNSVTALTKDLTGLYQDPDFSDFKVCCGTNSFPTHRGILSARSPVFKAMLSANMREALSSHVDVKDLDPSTLSRFLTFLYSGTCEEDLKWEDALRLYYAADKYQVPSLKGECLAVLCSSVMCENVCDILSLADKHQDKKLSSVAQDFILKNYNEVLGSQNWEKFILSDSLLAVKTLTHFAKNNYVKKSDSD